MKYFDVSHGSQEWFDIRIGKATASNFNKIVTPAKLEFSKQAEDYANLMIAEMILGQCLEKFAASHWMERGAILEADARALYQFETGFTLERGGFITNDAGTIGCSPDVRVANKDGRIIGCAEIKCPAPWTHVESLLRDSVDTANVLQVQGQIMIGGFEFNDWFSYHPEMPPARIRTLRDEKVCTALAVALGKFEIMVKDKIAILTKKGVLMPTKGKEPPKAAPGVVPDDILAAC